MKKVISFPVWEMPGTEPSVLCNSDFFESGVKIFFQTSLLIPMNLFRFELDLRQPHNFFFRNLFFAFSLIFLFSSFLSAQRYPNPIVDSLLNKGIDNILNQNYKSASMNFFEIKNKFPTLPFPYIYLAATEIAKSYDFDEIYNDPLINSYLDEALSLSENSLKNDDKNTWSIYSYALAEGYMAYYKALRKNWLSSISSGYDSYRSFQKILQFDSAFYDAYTAIGNFKYWKNSLTGFLNFLPFISDEREDGIKFLLKAVNNSSYNSYLAIHSLQWIYIDQKKYKDAIKISDAALQKYPGSRFFMWGLGRAYEEVDSRKAIEVYNEILDSYSSIKKLNEFHEILLKHLIAQQYKKLDENDKALKLCNEILKIDYTSVKDEDKIEARIERVKELRKEILAEKNNKH